MSCCGVMDFGHGDAHSPMCYMIWILRNILAKNVDFAQFVRYCKDKEGKQSRRRELTMWKKHKHLFLFPVAVLGILAVCWTSGQVSEFDKWYLIIAGTVGLYCWVSELVALLRERKKEQEEP